MTYEPVDAARGAGTHRIPVRRRRLAVLAAVVAVLVLAAGAAAFAWPSGDGPARPAAAGTAGGTAGGAASPSPSPSASQSGPPSPSVAASPSAAPRTSAAAPRPAGGKPGPGNTGVPAGTRLTVVTGDQVYATAGQVVSGLDIHGFVRITARNVTIRDSVIRGGPNPKCNSSVLWVMAGASATVEDSEIAPSSPSPCLDGIWALNATLLRMNIHGAVDGVKAYDNVTLQDSWVHDLSWFASDPNQGGGATHNDDVQTYEGNQHITLRHNTMSPGPRGNAAYQVTQDGGKVATDLHIDGNWLDGGGCTLNFAHKGGPTPMTGIYVTNNRFGRGSTFQCPILISTKTVLSQNSGNVWDDTGAPIPKPQQHD